MKDKIKSLYAAVGYIALAMIGQILIIGVAFLWIDSFTFIKALLDRSKDYKLVEILGPTGVPYLSILTWPIIFLLIGNIASIKGKSFFDRLSLKRLSIERFVFSLGIGISICCINIALGMLKNYDKLFGANSAQVSGYLTMGMSMGSKEYGSMFISTLGTMVIAPIVEEIFFRGIIYKTLSKNFSTPFTIGIQALLFGLLHFHLGQMIYSIVLGIILGYVMYRTESLYAALIIHITSKAWFLVTLRFSLDSVNSTYFIKTLLIGIVGTGALIGLLIKNTSKKPKKKDISLLEEVE